MSATPASSPSSILITGANRGIGLGLVQEFLRRGWRVLATVRPGSSPDRLTALARTSTGSLEILPLDVRDHGAVAALGAALAARLPGLDVLVNNAGVHPAQRGEKVGTLTLASISDTLAVNTLGPIAVTQALLPLLRTGRRPRVVHVSSGAGSLKTVVTASHYGYGISKAALNMFMRRAAIDLQPFGITTVAVSPGWVRTDMGGADASLGLEEAVGALAATIERLAPEQNGQWLDRFGKVSEFAW